LKFFFNISSLHRGSLTLAMSLDMARTVRCSLCVLVAWTLHQGRYWGSNQWDQPWSLASW